MRACLSAVLASVLVSCTTMPDKYTRGDPEVWPRWGFEVSNETEEGFDLEIIYMKYVMVCTAADGQMESAKELFITCADGLAKDRGRQVEPVPMIELACSHVRNVVDGWCSIRVGKRLRFVSTQ